MSNPSGPNQWTASTSSGEDEPLVNYRKKPFISRAGPHRTYLGRVVIEFWDTDTPTPSGEAGNIAMTVDAVHGKNADLLARVVAALTAKMQQGNPFENQ